MVETTNSSPTTHLILFLHPENEEHAFYLVAGEILIDRENTPVEAQEGVGLCQMAAPFLLPYKEKRITLALTIPITPEHIKDLADRVTIGLLVGFLVRGEIDLGRRVINNLGT
jgi:hypothetical protein